MIYSNVGLVRQDKEMDWGTLTRFTVGEEGRGRKLMSLPVPQWLEKLEGEKLYPDLTIGETKTGRPRIVKGTDTRMFMILSAEGGYTRRGDGVIYVRKGTYDKIKTLASGNGADGDAGRVGFWMCACIEVPNDDFIIRVRTSGSGYGTPSDFYIVHQCAVYHAVNEDLEATCEHIGIDMPCTITEEDDGFCCKASEWEAI